MVGLEVFEPHDDAAANLDLFRKQLHLALTPALLGGELLGARDAQVDGALVVEIRGVTQRKTAVGILPAVPRQRRPKLLGFFCGAGKLGLLDRQNQVK